MKRPAIVHDLLDANGGPLPALTPERFILGRYPYTYAADFLRQNVPGLLSREEASLRRQQFAATRRINDRRLAVILANCYLRENNVQGGP